MLLAVVLASGCTKRTDLAVQEAWQTATSKQEEAPTGSQRRARAARQTAREPTGSGWTRIVQMVGLALDDMERRAGDETMLKLASSWCAQNPTAQDTPHGSVRVCYPEPPVTAGNHAFTLEFGNAGVFGLVAGNLSDTSSLRLLQEALEGMKATCDAPWAKLPARADDAHQEIHTCVLSGGAVLAVGRFPRDLAADLWQVSVTLLAAT